MLGLAGMRLYGAIAGAVVVALFLAWVMRVNHLRGQYKAALAACEANHKQFVADVQAKTAEAQRLDALNKTRVETSQEKARTDNDAEIRRRIAAAVAAVRVQPKTAANGVSGRGAAPVSSAPPASQGADGAGQAPLVQPADLEICAANTELAIGWQAWWRSVEAIPR